MRNLGDMMTEFRSSVVTRVGSESHPILNSSCDMSQHFCFIAVCVDFDSDFITLSFVVRTAPNTSCKHMVAVVSFIGRVDAEGIAPTMGIPRTKSFGRDSSG